MKYRDGHWYVQKYRNPWVGGFAMKCALALEGYEYVTQADNFDTWREAFNYALRDGKELG